MATEKVMVLVGSGPGLGASIAKKFASHGYAVGLLSRHRESFDSLVSHIQSTGQQAFGVECDSSEPSSVEEAFAALNNKFGRSADVLVYNAGAFEMGPVSEVSTEKFVQCWKTGCLGAFLAVKQVLPEMERRRAGSILLTGATASLRGAANFSCLSVGKFGLRSLGQSLAKECGPKGIHVAHVVVDGVINTPRTKAWGKKEEEMLNPDSLAEVYWQLHMQEPTVWTQELDVRPNVEKW